MKFIFSDSLDLVTPGYDFLEERNPPGHRPHWDEVYPHELMDAPPYDGIMVSRAIVGNPGAPGKYSQAQATRFRQSGARSFLRLTGPQHVRMDLFGDCGAFTYAKEEAPPYRPDETARFYEDCGFTHGCSVDHIIFEFNQDVSGVDGGSEDARRRFELTLEKADAFLSEHRALRARFIPLGVVQGWSPASMAEAACRLVSMGYTYLAIGGMVRLKAPEIRRVVHRIRDVIPAETRLHLLGFAKADEIDSFAPYRLSSFDSTSPMLRAFVDGERNYYLPGNGRLRYYTAIRLPRSSESPHLRRLVESKAFRIEDLARMESVALAAIRAYDRNEAELSDALSGLLEYTSALIAGRPRSEMRDDLRLAKLAEQYRRTLVDRPWKQCKCAICHRISVEVILFRGSNRNKRRGIHNLAVYKRHVENLDLR